MNVIVQEIDFEGWYVQMEQAGWVAVVDVFGVILQYQFERPKGRVFVVDACYFGLWAGLRMTPRPF